MRVWEGRFGGVRISGGAYVKSGLKPWWRGRDVEGKCAKVGKRGRRQSSIHTKGEGEIIEGWGKR